MRAAKENQTRNLRTFARSYGAALRRHIRQRSKPHFQSARRLGNQAVSIGLETLDVARVHKTAVIEATPRDCALATKKRIVKKAEMFFIEAITPIEETHRAGVQWAACLGRKNKSLARHTAHLAAATHQLKKGVTRRKTAEAALRKGEKNYAVLLQQSAKLQKHLQSLAHRILSSQEDQRQKISHDLREEIAQTLLGLNVRLSTLRRGAAARNEALANDIANTQKLLGKSLRSISGFARKLRPLHEK